MVVGMQHQQQQPHASPATVLEDATTPCVGSPPVNTPSTVESVNGDVSDGDGSEKSATSAASAPAPAVVTSSMAVPVMANSTLYTTNNRVKLRDVNPHLVCVLCHGYFVDATSIAECLHSFCRSCIILHLGAESCCPICKVQINNSKPHLSLKPDKTLQDIVYKLVPGLFHYEMKRRKQFYESHPDRDLHLHPEFRGITVDRLVYSPQDNICLSLKYYDKSKEKEEWETAGSHRVNYNKFKSSANKNNLDDDDVLPTKHFSCPATVHVMELKKLIRLKYNLEDEHKVELFYRRESLPDEYSLMDIAYIYAWKRNSPMRLYYKINILTTVTEPADKIAMDAVEHDSSQLSPASEQEQAVLKNGNELDVDEDNKVDLINGDTVKRPGTPTSPSATASKVKENIAEGCKGTSTSINGTASAEKLPLLSKIVNINSSNPSISSKTPSAKSSPVSTMTTGKTASAKYRNTTADKKEAIRLKLKSTVSNLKPISSEAKNPTPIRSYLSISSILSDFDKPEVSKKQLPKHPRKPSEDSNNVSSNLETPDMKPSLVPLTSTESVPKTTSATTTNNSASNHSSLALDANSLKPIVPETVVNQPVPSVVAKTEPMSNIANAGRKTPVVIGRKKSTTNSGCVKTLNSSITHANSTPDKNLLKPIVAEPVVSQPVSSAVAKTDPVSSIANTGKNTLIMTVRRKSNQSGVPMVVVSVPNGSINGRKTPVSSGRAPSPSVKISVPVETPSPRTEVPVKSSGSSTKISAQSTANKALVSDQNCDGKTTVSAPDNATIPVSAAKSTSAETAMSTSLSLPSPNTKVPELTSASLSSFVSSSSSSSPSSGMKTLPLTSVSSLNSDMKTSSTSVNVSSTPSSGVQTLTSTLAPVPSAEMITSPSALNSDAKPPTLTAASAPCSDVKIPLSTSVPATGSDLKTSTVTSVATSCSGDKTPLLTSSSLPSQVTSASLTSHHTKVSTSTLISSLNAGTKSSTQTLASSFSKTSASTSVFSSSSTTKTSTSTSSPVPSPSRKVPSLTSVSMPNVNSKTTTVPTMTTVSSAIGSHSKTSAELSAAKVVIGSSSTPGIIPSKVSVNSVVPAQSKVTSATAPTRTTISGIATSKSAPTTVTSSMKSTPIFTSILPMTKMKPPPPLVPTSSKVPISSNKTNTTSSMVATTSLAKSLSIPSSTSISLSTKSLPPPLITLTSTSTTSTLVTSKELAASQYIPANTKIPSSLEISFTNSKEMSKPSPVSSLQKLVQHNFTNNAPLANGTPKSNHIIGKKSSLDDKVGVKRAFIDDKKSKVEPEIKMSRQSSETLSVSTNAAAPKKVFSPNILPEVSITLNPHPEQNKRITPETSYDVSCFKPNDSVANNIPPLTPINAPMCKNIQNSPIKNLNKKLPSNGVRIIRNSSSSSNMANKLKHGLNSMGKQNGEPEVKKPMLENGSQHNGAFESMNGKQKSYSPAESASSPSKSTETKTPSPTSVRKEARHQGIPKLIDINAAQYSKLITQDAKARLQFLKNTLYVNPSAEPAANSDNVLDLSSPSSSKSPSSDKSEPSPEKRKLIPSVPPHMIPVTMAKNDTKSSATKTSPTLSKIERKPSPIAKLDKSPARKADFRLDNGSPSTPISRSPHSPMFPKNPSPMGPLHLSPPLNPALAMNFLHPQQYSRELMWLMDAIQNGQLPSHPLMHQSLKPPAPTSEAAFHVKK